LREVATTYVSSKKVVDTYLEKGTGGRKFLEALW
jgi:hypothetical protein